MHAELTVYREERHIDLMWDVSVHTKCILPVDLGLPGLTMVVLVPGRFCSSTLAEGGGDEGSRRPTHIKYGLRDEVGSKQLVGIHVVSDPRARKRMRLSGTTLATTIS